MYIVGTLEIRYHYLSKCMTLFNMRLNYETNKSSWTVKILLNRNKDKTSLFNINIDHSILIVNIKFKLILSCMNELIIYLTH